MSNTDKPKYQGPKFASADVTFTCPECGKLVETSMGELMHYSSEQECDMCGSHGERKVEMDCPSCKKTVRLWTEEW